MSYTILPRGERGKLASRQVNLGELSRVPTPHPTTLQGTLHDAWISPNGNVTAIATTAAPEPGGQSGAFYGDCHSCAAERYCCASSLRPFTVAVCIHEQRLNKSLSLAIFRLLHS